MRPSADQDPDVGDAVRLNVTLPTVVSLDAARDALRDVTWLGRPVDAPGGHAEIRRIATDLELPIRDGSAPGPVRKAALIDLEQPRITDGEITVAVSWRSATLAPLFPVFAGELRVSATGLSLHGGYMPPFGRLGLVIDAALLHFVARRTAQAFLARFAHRFEEP